jgi:histidyl-tRNA synthetase
MEIKNPKGTRDFSPPESILRNDIISVMTKTFELYGYNPIMTPAFESYDLLTAKFAGGTQSDVMKEIFKFSDQGKRSLGLKFDNTVPLARFIAQNPTLKLPIKRYCIDRVYRDGPIKLGRYREFWQCDIDIIGSKELIADSELVSVALKVFSLLKIDVVLEINNRKFINAVLKNMGVIDKEVIENVIIIIDKIRKISKKEFEAELTDNGLNTEQINKLNQTLVLKKSNSETIKFLRDMYGADENVIIALEDIEKILNVLSEEELSRVEFNPALARGLNYYTGSVFEVFTKDSKVTSSLLGGGRYDNLIGKYAGNKEFPAVGVAFGLEPIMDVMKEKGIEEKKTTAQVYVVPISEGKIERKSIEIANELRDNGINVQVDLMKKGISKNLKFANYYNIPYVIIIGEDEVSKGVYQFKNMITGEQEELSVEGIIAKF